MNGFTYNGVHSSEYNVYYTPDHAARWWKEAEFETYKKDVAWRHGGYRYGTSVNIREINLSCYFEEIDIATRERIRKWLGRNTSGTLVFDEMPFVYYKVAPANVVPGKIYEDTDESLSGTFTITFIAVDPFGYLTRKSNDGTEDDNAADYCGIIAAGLMPPAPSTSGNSFSVYNPGTEPCGLKIMLAGTCDNPIRFFNNANKTQCVISSLPSNGIILDIDGDTGMVKVYASLSSETYDNGFAYHDYGTVRLEPNTSDQIDSSAQNPYANINLISIEEKTVSGNWATPTTLSLSHLSIDYKPRLL